MSEAGAGTNSVDQLRHSNPHGRVARKYPPQNVVQFIRHGEDGLQKFWVASVCPVGGIFKGGLLPRVASTGEVHQNNTQAPDIIGGTVVGRPVGWFQAF